MVEDVGFKFFRNWEMEMEFLRGCSRSFQSFGTDEEKDIFQACFYYLIALFCCDQYRFYFADPLKLLLLDLNFSDFTLFRSYGRQALRLLASPA